MQAGTQDSRGRRNLLLIRRAIEGLWLAAVFLTPLASTPSDWMVSYIQLPKAAILRTLVSLAVSLWMLEWAVSGRGVQLDLGLPIRQSVRRWVAEQPGRAVTVAAAVFMAAYVASALLSPSIRTSVWGQPPEHDGYSLYNMLAYFGLFMVISTHLRTLDQARRLAYALVAAGVVAAVLGVLAHMNVALLDYGKTSSGRVQSVSGNPIFFGAFLVMTLTVSLGAFLAFGDRAMGRLRWPTWTVIMAVQLAALVLSLSRGPWVGLAVAAATFLLLAGLFLGGRSVIRAVLLLGMAFAVAMLVTRLPEAAPAPKGGSQATTATAPAITPEERLFSIREDVAGGGLNNRIAIWEASARLALDRPWLPGEEMPLSPLRPLIGYGPELYRYVFPLEATPITDFQLQAHNYVLHLLVELGYVGVLAHVGLLSAASIIAGFLLVRGRRTMPDGYKVLLVTAASGLAGWVVTQSVGIPRSGDTVALWALLSVLAALPGIAGQRHEPVPFAVPPRHVLMPRAALASVVVLALLWGVWAKNVNPVRADFAAASAYSASDISEAVARMDRAVSLAPNLPTYYDRRADLLRPHLSRTEDLQGRAALAERIYVDRALAARADPLSPGLSLKLANAAVDLARLGYKGMSEQAIETYDRLLERAPGRPETRVYLLSVSAIAHIESGRLQEAMIILDELMEMHLTEYERARTLFLQGVAYAELGEFSQAEDVLKATLEIESAAEIEVEARHLLAWIAARTEQGADGRPVSAAP